MIGAALARELLRVQNCSGAHGKDFSGQVEVGHCDSQAISAGDRKTPRRVSHLCRVSSIANGKNIRSAFRVSLCASELLPGAGPPGWKDSGFLSCYPALGFSTTTGSFAVDGLSIAECKGAGYFRANLGSRSRPPSPSRTLSNRRGDRDGGRLRPSSKPHEEVSQSCKWPLQSPLASKWQRAAIIASPRAAANKPASRRLLAPSLIKQRLTSVSTV